MTRAEAIETVRVMERFGLHASARVLRKRHGLDKPSDHNKATKVAQQANK